MTPERLADLWAVMAGAFGHTWTSAFGDGVFEPDRKDGSPPELTIAAKTWRHGLSGYSDREIKRGLSAAIATSSEWPPNLSQFRDLCRPPDERRRERLRIADAAARRLALPPPGSTWAEQRARGAERVAEIKAMLRGRGGDLADAGHRLADAGQRP